jgi:hypothetical protein
LKDWNVSSDRNETYILQSLSHHLLRHFAIFVVDSLIAQNVDQSFHTRIIRRSKTTVICQRERAVLSLNDPNSNGTDEDGYVLQQFVLRLSTEEGDFVAFLSIPEG